MVCVAASLRIHDVTVYGVRGFVDPPLRTASVRMRRQGVQSAILSIRSMCMLQSKVRSVVPSNLDVYKIVETSLASYARFALRHVDSNLDRHAHAAQPCWWLLVSGGRRIVIHD